MLTAFNALFCGAGWRWLMVVGLSHSHFVPGIVSALTAFPLASSSPPSPPRLRGGWRGPGILQRLELELVLFSSRGLGHHPLSIMSGFDLRSCCPVGFFSWFFFFLSALQPGPAGLLACFPATRELRASGCGAETQDRECLLPDPRPCGCFCVLGSKTPFCCRLYTTSLLAFSLCPGRLRVQSQCVGCRGDWERVIFSIPGRFPPSFADTCLLKHNMLKTYLQKKYN